MTGRRIRLAREAAGLTQGGLAADVGISQGALSLIEAGRTATPSDEHIRAIAEATGYPVTYFALGEPPTLREGNYRKLQKVSRKHERQILAQTCQIVEIVQMSEGVLKLPDIAVRPLAQHADMREVEAYADEVRGWLKAEPLAPIPNLIRAVERAGVVVARLQLEIEGFDGFHVWMGHEHGDRPVVTLGGGHPGDRDRFSVAHELSHMVLHKDREAGDPREREREAHRLAGALLLPAEVARQVIRPPVTLAALTDVKAGYGISIAACVARAYALDIITRAQRDSLHRQIATLGWRTHEPVSVAQEQPLLFPQIVKALSGRGAAVERAERLGLPVFMFQALVSAD